MGKPRGKKAKNNNQLLDEKKKKLQKYWDCFQSQCEEFETRLQADCTLTSTKISKLYADKLKSLPENIRNMTLTEYLALQQQEAEETNPVNLQDIKATLSIRSQYEKSKFDSEKKKTLKKNRSERKRSLSVSICSSKKALPQNHQRISNLPRISRVMSESCLSTPKNKQSVAPAFVVTPKFDPRMPVVKALKRKPKAGELVLSMSGSPLHNFVDDIAKKPSVALSVGGGNYINITEDTEVAKLESDFLKKLDEETKSSLATIKQKLDLLLEKK